MSKIVVIQDLVFGWFNDMPETLEVRDNAPFGRKVGTARRIGDMNLEDFGVGKRTGHAIAIDRGTLAELTLLTEYQNNIFTVYIDATTLFSVFYVFAQDEPSG